MLNLYAIRASSEDCNTYAHYSDKYDVIGGCGYNETLLSAANLSLSVLCCCVNDCVRD